MSKIIYVMLLFIMSCGYHGHVRFDRINVKDVSLRAINSDSVALKYTVCFEPKSIGRKAYIVIIPLLVDQTDTSTFHCRVYAGERTLESGAVLAYNAEIKCLEFEEKDSFIVNNFEYFQIIGASVKDSSRIIFKKPVKEILIK